jgi:hypothetical protein
MAAVQQEQEWKECSMTDISSLRYESRGPDSDSYEMRWRRERREREEREKRERAERERRERESD